MQTRQAKRKRLEETSRAESQVGVINVGQSSATATNNIFDNDVVFRLIGDYLWIPDLKILRQASKSLLAKVNGLPKFVQNLKITITDDTVKETSKIPQINSVGWKIAKINMIHTSPTSYQQIHINSLTDLQLDYPFDLNDEYETPKTREELSLNRSSCYRFLRSSVFNLKSLSLDVMLLRYDIPATTFTGLIETLENLNFTGEWMDYSFSSRREIRNIEINLAMIGSLARRLKTITVHSGFEKASAAALTGILVSSRNTIEKIKFTHENAFDLLTGIHELQFPLLKELQLTFEVDWPAFTGFLNLQPKLESLLICLSREINPDFLDAVRRNSTPNLRNLQVAANFIAKAANLQLCNFIQELRGLKEFMIGWNYIEESENTLIDILRSLPPTLEVLDISDCKVPDDTIEPDQTRLITALNGFPNLTHLMIRNCGDNFTDGVLQAICRSCTLLRNFGFSADNLTTFGLTGEKKSRTGELESSGVSLRNLTGLRTLSIVMDDQDEMANVTIPGVVKAIQFRELKVAELSALNIPDTYLFQLAKNNPCLENLSRSVYGIPPENAEYGERYRFSRLLSINPRLTRIYTIFKMRGMYIIHDDDASDYGEMCHRPSYGVPGRKLNGSTIRRIRTTMKLLNSAQFKPDRMYCYDL